MVGTDRVALSRHNIRRALHLRGRSSFDASVAIKKNRTYFDDFLRERKASISFEAMHRLSEELDIHEFYTTGLRKLPERIEDIEKYSGSEPSDIKDEVDLSISKIASLTEIADLVQPDKRPEILKMIDVERFELESLRIEAATVFKPEGVEPCGISALSWSTLEKFVLESLRSNLDDVVFEIVKDSAMTGSSGTSLQIGDLVFIDKSRTNLQFGGLFAINYRGEMFLRQVELVGEDTGTRLKCKASNPDYPAFEVPLSSDLTTVGRIIAHIRRV